LAPTSEVDTHLTHTRYFQAAYPRSARSRLVVAGLKLSSRSPLLTARNIRISLPTTRQPRSCGGHSYLQPCSRRARLPSRLSPVGTGSRSSPFPSLYWLSDGWSGGGQRQADLWITDCNSDCSFDSSLTAVAV